MLEGTKFGLVLFQTCQVDCTECPYVMYDATRHLYCNTSTVTLVPHSPVPIFFNTLKCVPISGTLLRNCSTLSSIDTGYHNNAHQLSLTLATTGACRYVCSPPALLLRRILSLIKYLIAWQSNKASIAFSPFHSSHLLQDSIITS